MIIDFDCEMSASVNSLTVNKTSIVKLTTRFFSEKMLMFAKLSLMSFIYDILETFYFPNDKTEIIYSSYGIEKFFSYHILIDMDSTSLCFIIICGEDNPILGTIFRDVVFEVIVQSNIMQQFNTSNEFWEKFLARDKSLEKKS